MQLPGVFVSSSCQMAQEVMLCSYEGWGGLGLWILCGQEPTSENSQIFLNRFSDGGAGSHGLQQGSCRSALLPGHEKTRHQGQQNSFFGDPNLADQIPQIVPLTWLADE